MKKFLSILSVMALLTVSLLAVCAPVGAAGRTKGDWTVSRNVTFDDNGYIHMENGDYATLNQAIDFSDANLDVTITLQYSATDAFIYLHLNEAILNKFADHTGGSKYTARLRTVMNNGVEKYNYNQGYIPADNANGYQGVSAYANKSVEGTTLTVRFKRLSDTQVQMYMNGSTVFGTAGTVNMLEYLGSLKSMLYLSVSAQRDTTITEVNGKAPLYESPRTKADWTVANGVSFDDNGYLSIADGKYATFNELIDFTDENLDVSITMTGSFANDTQYFSVYFSKEKPAGAPTVGTNIYKARFFQRVDSADSVAKYGLNASWKDGAASMGYGGLKTAADEPLTIRFKRNAAGVIKLTMNDVDVYWGTNDYSTYINGLGTGYLTVATEQGLTATVTAVNGKAPIHVVPRTATSWNLADKVVFNADGTLPLSHAQYATLDEAIDLTADDLDVSVKLFAPFANGGQMFSVYLSKQKPTAAPTIGKDVFKARFQYNVNEDKYGLNQTYTDGTASGAYAGPKTPYTADALLTINFKRVNGTIQMTMNGENVYWGTAGDFANYINNLGTAYLSFDVESAQGPISVTVLEINGKTPVKVSEVEDTHTWTDVALTEQNVKMAGRTTPSKIGIALDWGMSGIEFNMKGTAAHARINYNHSNNYGNEWMAVYVNGVRTDRFELSNGVNWYTLDIGDNATETTNVRLVKCNSLTVVDLVDLQIDGTLEAKPADKELVMEVIGDSISAGYGVLGTSTTDPMSMKNSDGGYTYGTLIAEALGAELYTVAQSGMGVVMNGSGSNAELMPDLYEMAQYPRNKSVMWDHTTYHPDFILVGLGTNDATGLMHYDYFGEYSNGSAVTKDNEITAEEIEVFKNGVVAYIGRLKTLHPDAKIMWAYGLMNQTLMQPLKEAVEAYGSDDVVFVELKDQTEYTGDSITGSGNHPNAKCCEAVAEFLLPKAQALLGLAGDAPVVPFTGGDAGILTSLVDGKQGLRFNHTLTTTLVDGAETVTINNKTYTVSKIGMLVSKNADATMTVGSAGVKNAYVTSARDIVVSGDQITYKFSVLIKNINQANKATDIYERPYIECTDGTILYGEVQVTNVLEMYGVLKPSTQFDSAIHEWMS